MCYLKWYKCTILRHIHEIIRKKESGQTFGEGRESFSCGTIRASHLFVSVVPCSLKWYICTILRHTFGLLEFTCFCMTSTAFLGQMPLSFATAILNTVKRSTDEFLDSLYKI